CASAGAADSTRARAEHDASQGFIETSRIRAIVDITGYRAALYRIDLAGSTVPLDKLEIIATLRGNEAALRAQGVSHVALFDSRARGDNRPDSDIDIMIDVAPDAPVGLFEYVAITQFLADLFPTPGEVAGRSTLKPSFGQLPSERQFMPS